MDIKTKKRIAKEIIIFFSAGILVLIVFLLSYPYNSYYNYKSNQTQASITSKLHQLDTIKTQQLPIKGYVQDTTKVDPFEEFGGHAVSKGDSLPIFDSKKIVEHNQLVDKFESDIKDLTIEKVNFNSHIMHYNEKINLVKYSSLLIFLICFPIRYLYYLIFWSFKTIKQKE